MANQRVYLDHNATSPIRPQIKEMLVAFLSEPYGNPSAVHTPGRKLRDRIDWARESVANLIGSKPSEIIFTSGGVESNHLAWHSFQKKECKIATTTTEHSCVKGATQKAKKCKANIHQIQINQEGQITPQEWERLIAFAPEFISIHHANNETGALYDLKSFVKQFKPNTWIHTDAVQTLGKIPVSVNDLAVDYLSISAHKLGALQGAGALYVRKGAPFESIWFGGSQERGKRSGTENVIGILSLGKACELIAEQMDAEAQKYEKLRSAFEQGLQQRIDGIHITAQDQPRTPNTSHIIFDGIDGESLLMAADLEGLDCSTGSACHSGSIEPSHVVTAMGFDVEKGQGAIRFSLGWNTTQQDIDYALEILPKLVQRIRKPNQR